MLLVVLDDIDDISFSKKIKVKNEGDTHIACVASVSNRRSYCAKVREGAKKGGRERRRGEEETLARKPHDSGKCPLIFHDSVDL